MFFFACSTNFFENIKRYNIIYCYNSKIQNKKSYNQKSQFSTGLVDDDFFAQAYLQSTSRTLHLCSTLYKFWTDFSV